LPYLPLTTGTSPLPPDKVFDSLLQPSQIPFKNTGKSPNSLLGRHSDPFFPDNRFPDHSPSLVYFLLDGSSWVEITDSWFNVCFFVYLFDRRIWFLTF